MEIEIGDKVKVLNCPSAPVLVGIKAPVVAVGQETVDIKVAGTTITCHKNDVEYSASNIRKQLDVVPKFYHGTDMRLCVMHEEYRKLYLKACHVLAKNMYYKVETYKEGIGSLESLFDITDEKEKTVFDNFSHELLTIEINLMGYEDFQYDSFYVTTSWMEAVQYAQNAFGGGEIGTVAYHILKGVETAGKQEWYRGHEDIVKKILDMGDGQHFPVVFEIPNVDLEKLRTEEDESVFKYIYNGKIHASSFRYSGNVVFDPALATPVSTSLKEELEKWRKQNKE